MSISPQDKARQILAAIPDTSDVAAMEELARQDPVIWCMWKRRLRGHPYTFDVSRKLRAMAPNDKNLMQTLLRHRPFLLQPLRDTHPHKVYEKARQIGVSELSINESLWFLDSHEKVKVVYTFPRDKQLTDFATTRIGEAFEETPRMRAIVGTPNQVTMKQIGPRGSYLLLRSAWESNLGEGIDADVVVFDEKDRMKEGIEVAFRESLKSSRFGWLREVSTPTLPGRGVDASYRKSDQHEWHVRCSKCGMWQIVDWPDNIVQMKDVPVGATENDLEEGTYEFACRKPSCRGLLDRLHGQWVAKYPSRKDVRGYWIPQTIAPWISATRLMKNKIQYKFQQLWTNYCLGKTSTGENVLITEEDFKQCIAGHSRINARSEDWERVFVGIDWGHLNWVVVIGINYTNQRTYLLNVGVFEDDQKRELDSVKHIEAFIAPYDPDIIVADGGYGKDRNTYLLRKYPGKLFACWYNPSDKASRTFQPSWQEGSAKVLIDRTVSLKNAARCIKEGEIGLPVPDQMLGLFIKHMLNLAPMRVEEEGEIYEVIDKVGDDHLAHAFGYALVAQERFRNSLSTFTVVGGWEPQ